MGVKHMLECFPELGAQFLMWQWLVERIPGNMEGSILKVKLTAPTIFCGTVVVTTCLKAPWKPSKHGTDMPVVTVSLDTTALSECNMAELVPVTVTESTARDMFYSGSRLGTVPGGEGNMTHGHTRACSALLFCLTHSHIFLKGVARKAFCSGAARQTAHPSPTWTDSVGGMRASLWPRRCLTTARPCTAPVSCTTRNWTEQQVEKSMWGTGSLMG